MTGIPLALRGTGGRSTTSWSSRTALVLAIIALSPDWGRGGYVGTNGPRVMDVIDGLLSTPVRANCGAQMYRAASATARGGPHMMYLLEDWGAGGGIRLDRPVPLQESPKRLPPMVGGIAKAGMLLCLRMGWHAEPLRAVTTLALRTWLEAAEPGSSDGLRL